MFSIRKEFYSYYQKISEISRVDKILFAIYISNNRFAVYDLKDSNHTIIELDNSVSLTKVALENMLPAVCKDVDNSLFYNSKIDNPFDLNIYDVAVVPLAEATMRCSWGFVSLYNLKDGKNNGFNKECLSYITSLNRKLYQVIIDSKLRIRVQQPYCGRMVLEQKLDKAMEFFSSVVHDMRTPINAVMGFLELLEQRVSTKDKEYVIASYRSAEMVASLINDVLDFSKIEAGKMELDIHYFSPIEEFKNIAYLFYKTAYDKGVDFSIYFDVNMPFAIRSDPYRLKQIINNFLSNAIKFTPEGKSVFMEVHYNSEDDTLQIDIKDEGIGMTEEEMKNLFKPFHQANNQISGKFGGTGLGLVVSKQLADMLGAKISVESKKGVASIFSLTLPCNTIEGTPRTICIDYSNIHHIYLVECESTYLHHIHTIAKYFETLGIKYEFISIDNIFDSKYRDGIFIFDNKKYDERLCNRILKRYNNRLIFIVSDMVFEISQLSETNILHRPVFPGELISRIVDISKGKIEDSSISKKPIRTLNIIVADDNKINLKLLEEVLKLQHTTPFAATNADEVLEIIRDDSNEIDMIFIDEMMHDTRGSDAIKEIRKIPKYKDIPIYSLTGSNDKYTIDLIRASGATDVLLKPLKNRIVEELINRYRNQLD